MTSCSRNIAAMSLVAVLSAFGCGSGNGPGNPDSASPDLLAPPDAAPAASFVRVHYRLQGAGDASAWGIHFFGAGANSPMWGSPQLFSKKDDFGVYTDIQVTATGDAPDAWLGLIPVLCTNGNCQKDVETSARFFDLDKSPTSPNIAECWITQGQVIQIHKPAASSPGYKIYRPREFIDLGNGSVRLMFRVAPGSTGTVNYGTDMAKLDQTATWTATDDINKDGLIVKGLTAGTQIYYQINSDLKANGQDLKDQSAILDLTPISFSTIADAGDWASWGGKGVMYELMVRSFADGGGPTAPADPTKNTGIDPTKMDGIGDLVGLRNALPYLKDVGADAIWMTPVFKAQSYHGYDTTDFYNLDPAVGSIKDFADLTAAAHAMGIKIVLDLVENHVADVNPWFIKATDPKDPDHAKYHEWFVWSDEYENMLTDKHPFDPTSLIWACKAYMCYHQIFGASIPELNYRNPEVRAEMKKISSFWLALGADGFRLDASKHIDQFDDNNGIALAVHGTHVWWKEFNHFVKKEVTRDVGAAAVILAGENRWDDPTVYKNMLPYAGDMDSQFDFPFRTLLANFVAGKTGDDVDFVKYINTLQTDSANMALGGNANHFFERFLSNHDLDRPASQFGGTMPLLGLLKQVATIVLTVPGMPVIYYGEEFGKLGQHDKFLGTEAYTHDEFIREPMSWYKNLTFVGDKMTSWTIDFAKTDGDNAGLMLGMGGVGMCKAPNPDYPFIKFMTADDPNSWAAQKDDPASLYSYYRQLVGIRKANDIFTAAGTVLTVVQNTADVYEFTLSAPAKKTTSVVFNRKGVGQTIMRGGMVKDLISGMTAASFDVPAYGALILQ